MHLCHLYLLFLVLFDPVYGLWFFYTPDGVSFWKLISFKEWEIIINSDDIPDQLFCRTIAKFISKWTGRIWQVSKSSSNIGKTLYEEDILKQQQEIEVMKNDPEIEKILNKYPGVKIHSITDIHETLDETRTKNNIQKSIEEK